MLYGGCYCGVLGGTERFNNVMIADKRRYRAVAKRMVTGGDNRSEQNRATPVPIRTPQVSDSERIGTCGARVRAGQ